MKFMLLSIFTAFCLYWLTRLTSEVIAREDPASVFADRMVENHPILMWMTIAWCCSIIVAIISIARFIIIM
jgi:hypothetical protein